MLLSGYRNKPARPRWVSWWSSWGAWNKNTFYRDLWP